MMKTDFKRKLTAAPYAVWMIIFTLVPMALIVFFAFTDQNGAFTLENVLRIKDFSSTFGLSIGLALIATVICLVLGYPLAFMISRMNTNRQSTMVMLIMLPMWMNFLPRTYAWMTILEKNGLINSMLALIGLPKVDMINTNGAIVLGMVYNFLPYMILPIYSVMTKIDKSVIEAAEDLGGGPLTVFKKVILPLSVPGIVSGINMVFVPAVSTFIISKLLGGGLTNLIGDVIDMYFLGGAGEVNYNLGSALSLVLMVLILICMGIMNLFDKDNDASSSVLI